MLKINYAKLAMPSEGALVLTVVSGCKLGPKGNEFDRKLKGAIKRAMASGKFDGGKDQVFTIPVPHKTRLSRIVLLGIGTPEDVTEISCQRAGGAMTVAMQGGKETNATLLFDAHKGLAIEAETAAANVAFGAKLRSYRFDKYRTKLSPEKKSSLKTIALAGDASLLKKAYSTLDRIAEGVFLTRDLINEPANVIYPETLADKCKELARLGVKVEILDQEAMKKLGMGPLLSVSQGSEFPPRLVTMYWQGNPGAKDKRPLALVGKGVTFDSGGLSLKPGSAMEGMKQDMSGAGAVIGVMKILADRKAKANVVGVVGLVENMPDGKASRPGDIVKSMSGQTIEILNTDAEGRLVLADALWFVQEKHKPHSVIDIATLTGAVKFAVGTEYAGLFDNDEALRTRLLRSGQAVDEKLWNLPMHDAYDKAMDSSVADMKNSADGSVGAGSATAAHFLKRFIKKDVVWAHLDIASVAWTTKDKPLAPKGAPGFGVRLLDRLISDYYEDV